jgi:hypothetical protein
LENEPARARAPLGKRLAPERGEIRILLSPLMDGEAAEVQPPARTRVGPQGLGSVTSAIRHGRCAVGAATGSANAISARRGEPGITPVT